MSQVRKIVTTDLEKSFSKQTEGMKSIVERAIQQGTIKQVTNRYGNKFDASKLQSRKK